MILAHSFVGVPIVHYLIKNKSEYQNRPLFENILYMVGIIAAVFPDFDLSLSFFIKELDHRKLVSHSLLPYLAIFILGIFVSRAIKKYQKEISILNLIFFVGVLSHLFFDFLVGGIAVFAPFSRITYGLPIYFNYSADFYEKYFSSFYVLLELPIIAFSIYKMIQLRKYVSVVLLPSFLFVVALVMIFAKF